MIYFIMFISLLIGIMMIWALFEMTRHQIIPRWKHDYTFMTKIVVIVFGILMVTIMISLLYMPLIVLIG